MTRRSETGTSSVGAATVAQAETLEPGNSPGFLLWRVSHRWQRLMTATLRPFGLSHVQFVLLASLWWLTESTGDRPSQRRLADFAGIDPMMTSQVVRTLETKGLVVRSAHPTDSRVRQLAVTREGADLARRTIVAVEAADRVFFVGTGRRGMLLEFLRTLAE